MYTPTWDEIKRRLAQHDSPGVLIYGIPPNGMILASMLHRALAVQTPEESTVILDDYKDKGEVRQYYSERYKKFFITLFDEPVLMPWATYTQGLRK